jgi:DNA ligase (NAD+)
MPGAKTRRLEYFAKRARSTSKASAGVVADKLVEQAWSQEPLDVFQLKLGDLSTLNLGTDSEPRVFGGKNAAKLLEAIQRPPASWLTGFTPGDSRSEETARPSDVSSVVGGGGRLGPPARRCHA